MSDAPAPEYMSLRAYAKRRGCTPMAVSVAVKDGRLKFSVTRDATGAPKIKDPDLADREWQENTQHSKRPPKPGERDEELDSAAKQGKLWDARTRELKFRAAAGELVPAVDVQREVEEAFVACKTHLLALPTRLRQQLPHLTVSDAEVIEACVREALEHLASRATAAPAPAALGEIELEEAADDAPDQP